MKRILFTITLTAAMAVQAQQVPVYLDESKPVEQRIEDALSRMTLDEKIAVIHAQSKFSSPGVKRLGFPDFWTDDGPHGVRPDVLWDEWQQAGQTNDSCVAFPALTCLAATWNPQLSRLYGENLGEEALYRGKAMILGPGVNIYRTPLGGRNFEYMGEDPYLASRMVVPYIQGLQSKGVAACVKHFAVNNDEEYRYQVNVKVSDRALHEIYLPAFKAAVEEGGTWGIMGSYGLYRDQHNCHNEYLLNNILKRGWKYDGVVVSDWGGAHDTEQAVKNGLDMEFGTWTNGFTTRELDDKVRRVLRLFYRTTMRLDRQRGFLCSEAHYDAARKIAGEGIVLLQNNKAKGGKLLPLNASKLKKVLVVGENAIKMMTVGGGSSSLKVQKEILPLDGISDRLRQINPQIEVDYARGYVGDTVQSYNGVTVGRSIADSRSPEVLLAEAVEKARKADCVIMVGGLNKADYQDAEGHDRKEYALPYGQDKLIEALAKANGNIIYVNISGNGVEMPWLAKVPAVVQGWFAGSESGEALADVLVGHALNTYPGTWRSDKQIIDEEYKEGIYVGYRWTDKQQKKPLFAFGYGLSYTTFNISGLKADKKEMTRDGKITFTATVTNTGKKAGAEVVQLYIRDVKSTVDRPMKELKGFQKVMLQPGESREVSITIDNKALSFYDEAAGKWTSEAGEFEALVGNASDNLRQSVKFTLKD